MRSLCNNYVEVHLKSTPEFARQFDKVGFFKRADSGEIGNVPGVSAPYEFSDSTELTFDMTKTSLEEVKNEVIKYLKANYS